MLVTFDMRINISQRVCEVLKLRSVNGGSDV